MQQPKGFFVRYFPLFVRVMNPLIVFMWRLGLGSLVNIWPSLTGRIMVLRHIGRKSGDPIYTPLNYFEENGSLYCAASQGEDSDWFMNLIGNPQAEVWLPDGWYSGQAEVIESKTVQTKVFENILLSANLIAQITGINPGMDESERELALQEYKFIRINRQSARTGADGPGGLAWLWPFILIFCWVTRPKKRK